MIPPCDLELEEDVVGSILAGWLPVESVAAEVFYRPAHVRIVEAVRVGSLERGYEVRGAAVVMTASGIDLDVFDRERAEDLATRAPVATTRDVSALAELARRRRIMLAAVDVYDAAAAGEDVSDVLAIFGSSA